MKQLKVLSIACVIAVLMLTIAGCCVSHEWEEATCDKPKTCLKCGKTEGEPLGHDPSDWIIKKEATILEPGQRIKECNRCKIILEEEQTSVPVYNNEKFLFSADEFAARLQKILDMLDDDIRVLDPSGSSNMVSIGVYSKNNSTNKTEALIIFADPGFHSIGGRTNKNLNASIVISIDARGHKYETDIINTAVIMACAEQMDEETAESILHEVQDSDKAIIKGDLTYTNGMYQDYNSFFVGFFE